MQCSSLLKKSNRLYMKHKKITEQQIKTSEQFVRFMWMATIGLIIWAMCLGGCTTQKNGCPDPYKWEAKNKFSK